MKTQKIRDTPSCLFLLRCHQQYAYGPARTYGPTLPLSALPGSPRDCDQPLLPRNPESAQISSLPPQYFGPPQSSCQSTSPGPVQISAAAGSCVVWQYGGHQSSSPGVNPSTTDESNTGNINPAKEFSIRIISVWGYVTQEVNTISQERVYWPNMYNSVDEDYGK